MFLVAIANLGLGLAAIIIRYFESPPCIRRCYKFANCCSRCLYFLTCCGCFGMMRRCRRCGKGRCHILGRFWSMVKKIRLRWFWFLMFGQCGFLIREIVVVTSLDGWTEELIAVHISLIIVFLTTFREVWQFAKVRPLAKRNVDQVLDMLMLPVNYGYACALCVRALRLQDSELNREMALAMVDSAELWESWALWSVLKLFVDVVDVSYKGSRRRARKTPVEETLKRLSLQGVEVWVFVLIITSLAELIWKGFVAQQLPTMCFVLYGSCMSCRDIYELYIGPIALTLTYMFCCLAIVFVFYFERAFHKPLERIEPYWKFLGVKCVVSVTYGQWVVLKYVLGLDERNTYLYHSLIVCLELPVLSFIHCWFAYPYGKEWMEPLFRLTKLQAEQLPEAVQDNPVVDQLPASASVLKAACEMPEVTKDRQQCEEQPEEEEEADSQAAAPEEMDEDTEDDKWHEEVVARLSALSGAAVAAASPEPHHSLISLTTMEAQQEVAVWYPCWNTWWGSVLCFFANIAWICICVYSAAASVFALVPLRYDLEREPKHIYTWVCDQEDLGHFIEADPLQHLVIPEDVRQRFRLSRIAGTWLPRCAEVTLQCAAGYAGRPSALCKANNSYELTGTCTSTICGLPPQVRNAVVVLDSDSRESTTIRFEYTCKTGYFGAPVAVCDEDGEYTVEGSCKEVQCGAPPQFPHATPVLDSTNETAQLFKVGSYVEYRCAEGYYGVMKTVCQLDGTYKLAPNLKHCSKICEPLPSLLHLHADVMQNDDTLVKTTGARVKFKCQAGWFGTISLVCDSDGKYQRDGSECQRVCDEVPSLSYATLEVSFHRTERHPGARLEYKCFGRFYGTLTMKCDEEGKWQAIGSCKRKCPDGPALPHAQLDLTNDEADGERLPGSYLRYNCIPGYHGMITALCNEDGKYVMSGSCLRVCTQLPQLARATPRITSASDLFLSGMMVVYTCIDQYAGELKYRCSASGDFELESGNCTRMCAPLPQIKHAWPKLRESQSYSSFMEGDQVAYQCGGGYTGSFWSRCGDDGFWSFPVGRECTTNECELLGDFLVGVTDLKWKDRVVIDESFRTLTNVTVGQLVSLRCAAGYSGRPVALCSAENWRLLQGCEPYVTSQGCRCAQQWTYCQDLFGKGCQQWQGCAPFPLGWCDVQLGSCPVGTPQLSWDHCTLQAYDVLWPPKAMEDQGLSWRLVQSDSRYALVLSLSLLVLCCMCGSFIQCCIRRATIKNFLRTAALDEGQVELTTFHTPVAQQAHC